MFAKLVFSDETMQIWGIFPNSSEMAIGAVQDIHRLNETKRYFVTNLPETEELRAEWTYLVDCRKEADNCKNHDLEYGSCDTCGMFANQLGEDKS